CASMSCWWQNAACLAMFAMPGWSGRERRSEGLGATDALPQDMSRRLRHAAVSIPGGFELPISARIVPYLAVGAAFLGLASLTSCVVPIVAGGAATTGYVAGQERDVGTQISDTALK